MIFKESGKIQIMEVEEPGDTLDDLSMASFAH